MKTDNRCLSQESRHSLVLSGLQPDKAYALPSHFRGTKDEMNLE